AALVVALRTDHDLVELIQRRFPKELENLTEASWHADLREMASPMAAAMAAASPNPTRGQKYERDKRSRRRRHFHNSIEYQFGGELEAELRKQPFFALSDSPQSHLSRFQDCLDSVFARGSVKMQKLEELFGMDRHPLGKLLRGVKERDYHAVVTIMRA